MLNTKQTEEFKRNYPNIIKVMIEEKLSIREMARRLNMPKTTLHRNLDKQKEILDINTLKRFNSLLENNKKTTSLGKGKKRKKEI